VVDCANGVGSMALKMLRAQPEFSKRITLELINEKDVSKLNEECGAEHVQKAQLLPKNWRHDG
jgi:hypothetical protein